jgi:ADP-ribose pyrophosphatase
MASEPRIIASKRIRDAWPSISEDEVQLPSGARKNWIRLHFGTSAAILAVTKEKEIVLTREYRHGLRRIAFSLPGGAARDGESADACARRELLEETGYEAGRVLELFAGNSLTGYLEGTLHLFFTRDCRPTDRRPNPDEIDSVERMSVTQALSDARSGTFESAVLTLAILLADARGWLVA